MNDVTIATLAFSPYRSRKRFVNISVSLVSEYFSSGPNWSCRDFRASMKWPLTLAQGKFVFIFVLSQLPVTCVLGPGIADKFLWYPQVVLSPVGPCRSTLTVN